MHRFSFLFLILICTACASDIEDQPPTVVRKEKRSLPSTPLTVSQLIGNGAYLLLSDNTVWAIHPADTILSGGWISAGTITVTSSNDPNYPFLLYNALTEDSVRAKKSSLDEVRQRIRSTESQKQQNIMEQQKNQKKVEELNPKAPNG